MSLKVSSWVWDHSQQSGTKKLILLALADIANHEGEAYPGLKRIARMAGVTPSVARKHIRAIEASGEIRVIINAGGKTPSGNTNLYVFTAYREANGMSNSSLPPCKFDSTPLANLQGDDLANLQAKPSLEPSGNKRLSPSGDAPENQTSPQQDEQPKPTKPKQARPRNALFDSIAAALGYDTANLTKNEGSRIGMVAAELAKVGVQPSEVQSLYDYCRRLIPGEFSVNALPNHVSAWRKSKGGQDQSAQQNVDMDALNALIEQSRINSLTSHMPIGGSSNE